MIDLNKITLMSADETKAFFSGAKDNILNASLSLAYHALHNSNVSSFVGEDMTVINLIDKPLRKYLPVKWNKETKAFEFSKENADKIRELLELIRGQFTFEEMCEAINFQDELAAAQAEKEKAEEEAEFEALPDEEKAAIKAQEEKQALDSQVKKVKKYLAKQADETTDKDKLILAVISELGIDKVRQVLESLPN